MDQRISLVTLAVADLGRSRDFYVGLGWDVTQDAEGIVAFDLLGQTLGLYPREALARDMGVDPSTLGTGAATLACNVRAVDDVARVLDEFRAAGGEVLVEAATLHWGGTVGFATDPDGHVWEVAHNPFSPLAADGRFRWHGYDDRRGDARDGSELAADA